VNLRSSVVKNSLPTLTLARYTKFEGKTGYNSGAYVRNSKDGAIWHQAHFGDAKVGFLFGQMMGAGE
jgi:hypothetical protein